ncbi:VacJ family lipoprotein [Oceanicella sp. SM1341]|uniref:MlaA family lipoprotein n=1 Tax=Oceanicella sp. SM1341 TaxID=1548889 RepID=UPI000E4AFC3B|nr:VacJ family lipoprotein [Oceanicella sp. SM1341]
MKNLFCFLRARTPCFAAVATIVLAGCADTEATQQAGLIADPYESTNRDIHEFNKGMDRYILRPVSQAYETVTPDLVRFLVANEANHLQLPVDAANHLMQGDIEAAGIAAGRFGFNTVFGAAGFLDPATEFGLPADPTDFGETLYTWGVGEGVYHELPFIGPRTTRDAVGWGVDWLIDPSILVDSTAFTYAALGLYGAHTLDRRVQNAELLDSLLYESEDSYLTLKTSYVQLRRRQLAGDSGTGDDALPDIFADD